VNLSPVTGFLAATRRVLVRAAVLWLAASAVPAAVFNPFDWTGFTTMFQSLALFLAPAMVLYALYALSAQWVRWRTVDDEGRREWGPSESGAQDYARINPGTGLPCVGNSTVDSAGRGFGQGYD